MVGWVGVWTKQRLRACRHLLSSVSTPAPQRPLPHPDAPDRVVLVVDCQLALVAGEGAHAQQELHSGGGEGNAGWIHRCDMQWVALGWAGWAGQAQEEQLSRH